METVRYGSNKEEKLGEGWIAEKLRERSKVSLFRKMRKRGFTITINRF